MTTPVVVYPWWAPWWQIWRERVAPLFTPMIARTTAAAVAVRVAVVDGWRRHVDKAATDPDYARTLAEAVSAVVRTVVTRSAVAAAIVVVATGILVPGDIDEPDDDEREPYQGGRRWRPTSASQPLWDRFPDD